MGHALRLLPLPLPTHAPGAAPAAWALADVAAAVATVATAVAATLALTGAGRAAAADLGALPAPPRHLPQRNLLIEVRQGDSSALDARGGGLQSAGVTVYSDGRITGQATGAWSARTEQRGTQAAQQVTVLNGGRASVRLSHTAPLQWWSVFVTPQGVQAAPSTQWVEAGQGFSVRPVWPGEGSPVTVELEAESSHLNDPGVQESVQESNRTLTTVQVPLNEWVTIASTAQDSRHVQAGVLSTRQATQVQQVLVQIRVNVR